MGERVELLAPAGDWEAFRAAVESGADAIYLGGKLFNARENANNFDNDEMKEAIKYAHIRGANVYLTMNTLVSDYEIMQATEYASDAYLMGIDGVIVQDLGLAGALKNLMPDLPLHASTQMTIYNIEGVRQLEKLGFKRVVLARELSIEQIKYIAQNTTVELEVFIHGALCISYSGQCLMSSIIGGRSGNRGKCAQPCRLPYALISTGDKNILNKQVIKAAGKYLLSPKDLCSINEIADISDSGVRSLKIEGRMKSPEYVATVVRIYRKYLDLKYKADESNSESEVIIEKEDLKDLNQIFNRGGLSKGYLLGKAGMEMMCYEKPKNWGVYLGKVISYDKAAQTFKIMLEEDLSIGDGIEVWNGEEVSPGTIVTELRADGKNVKSIEKGHLVTVGSLKTQVFIDNKVYKTSDKSLNTSSREVLKGKGVRKIRLKGKASIRADEFMGLSIWDEDGNHIELLGEEKPAIAVNVPLTYERVYEQLNKTGTTPFVFESLEIEIGENLSLPISVINNIRRKALEEIEKKRAKRYSRIIDEKASELKHNLQRKDIRAQNKKPKLTVLFYQSKNGLKYSELGADRIYLPLNLFFEGKSREIVDSCHKNDCEVFFWLPSVTRGNYDRLIETKMKGIVGSGADGLLIGNLGQIEQINRLGLMQKLTLFGDTSLNVFNSSSIYAFQELGLKGLTLSYELTLKQIERLSKGNTRTELVVYGRIPLMTSEYCPIGSILGGATLGRKCSGPCDNEGMYGLRDRKGMEFPVICDKIDCRSTLMNANVLLLLDNIDKIINSGADYLRLNITDEDESAIKKIIETHRLVLNKGAGSMQGYEALIRGIKERGFTKGHYFRGV
jgi:putative protease